MKVTSPNWQENYPIYPDWKRGEGGDLRGGGVGLVKSESKKVIIVTNDVQKNNSINNVQINKNTKL